MQWWKMISSKIYLPAKSQHTGHWFLNTYLLNKCLVYLKSISEGFPIGRSISTSSHPQDAQVCVRDRRSWRNAAVRPSSGPKFTRGKAVKRRNPGVNVVVLFVSLASLVATRLIRPTESYILRFVKCITSIGSVLWPRLLLV